MRIRLRTARTGLADINWRDALAVYSVVLPALLLSFSIGRDWRLSPADWIQFIGYDPRAAFQIAILPVAAAIAAPLIGLRYRRTASLIALGAAISSGLLVTQYLTSVHVVSGIAASYALAFLIEAFALAGSLGPRRGFRILTPKSWVVPCASALAGWLVAFHLFGAPIWLAVLVLVALLAAVAVALLTSTPRPVAPGLIALLAVPAYPWTIWAIAMIGTRISPMPLAPFLPTLLLAGLVAAAIWRPLRRAY